MKIDSMLCKKKRKKRIIIILYAIQNSYSYNIGTLYFVKKDSHHSLLCECSCMSFKPHFKRHVAASIHATRSMQIQRSSFDN